MPRKSLIAECSVKYIVLDEADKLFELGLLGQTDEILAACTSKRLHKALFSATIPAAVEELARSIMTEPLRVVIGMKYIPLF
jgi:ATP-dependent RNA helicase DDX52/ROK1